MSYTNTNLFLEINRKNEDHLEYLDYTINILGELAISISEDVDIINNLRRTYALNWSEYKKKVPQKDAWPDGTTVPQYFSYADYYEDATIGIKTPEDTEKTTSDVLSIINSIISFVPGYSQITYVFGIVLGTGGYISETAEDTVFDADLIIGEDSMYKEFSQHNIRDTIIQSWLDNDKEYESVVTITHLKFQNPGKNEIIMQLFADLDGKDILFNKQISLNILGIDDEHDQPNEQIWGDVVLENGFEVLDNEIMYSSAMGDDPQLCTAISVSRKVSKDDPNKQVLYFEISRKTDPENDHSYYINLRNVIFQISFNEDTDIIYSKIKDYEIGERNFNKLFYKGEYEIWPDGDNLTEDIESYIPLYFEYTDVMIYPETYEGRHHNFYQEIPPVSDSKEKMAKSKLLLTLVPYCWPITLMCAFDTFVEMVWQEKYGVDFVDNQKPYEEFLNTNERDLVVRGFLHERAEDDYESIVSEIPIILNQDNLTTDVYFTILFSVIGEDTKTAAYSKKITLKNDISPGEQLGNTITNTIGMEFVLIPAGEFAMGSPPDEVGRYDNEGPVHHVNIEKAFYMGRYEVTQKQWREIMGDNPFYFESDDLPVEQFSWDDVQEFITKLNEKEGTDKYRLPSEVEWEYACRAGTTTRYSFGDDESKLGDYAWYDDNSGYKTHPVGQKKPNPWRLYDMHGNVGE